MAIRKIKICGDSILCIKSEKVGKISASIKKIINDMCETLTAAKGLGLAAPQIGISKSIIVVDLSSTKTPLKMILINPKILKKYGKEEYFGEGCLSVPEIYEDVLRPTIIDIEFEDIEGKKQKLIELNGLLARVIQHEVDHLNGILFIDRLEPDKRSKIADQIDNLIKKSKLSNL